MHQSITEVQCDLEDTIILNVGGVKHETRRSTLEKWPLTTLADNTILQRHFRPKSGDFYFDRHPGNIFKFQLFKIIIFSFTPVSA